MTLLGPTSQSFISQRLRLHYVDWGNPDKPLLMLIHGGRDHCRSWDWTAEALRDDWHVVAMDHRGHGDSEWVSDGNYVANDMIYDVAQFIHQFDERPVTIVSHSMGGNVSLRLAGIFPELVRKMVVIEGLGPSPKRVAELEQTPFRERMREWIGKKHKSSGRIPRRYASIDEALARMIEENSYLTPEQARHLTIHGVNRNEDGTYSWKFDPHLNNWPPHDPEQVKVEELWAAIEAPVLMLYGADSWASNPVKDGRMESFRDARVIEFENAGHWLHHDQFERFVATLKGFL
ncbi:MAG: alpha/beta hydrolase [Sphingomonadales bacterium]|nr:alpha/beta hydrolase [Sphingomonadales bacterium]MDE2569157.1 alpha/beta hydrolase [Sphingomonadales bacterium]